MQPLFRQEPLRSRRKARLSSVEDTLCRQAASSPPRRGVLAIRPPVSSPPLPSASRPSVTAAPAGYGGAGGPAGPPAPTASEGGEGGLQDHESAQGQAPSDGADRFVS